MRRIGSALESLMNALAWGAGTFFPVVMLASALLGGWLIYASGADYDTGVAPLLGYVIGFVGISMKVAAVFLRGGLGRRGRPTLLNLGFTYERLALALLIGGVILVRIEITHPGISVDLPPWLVYGMIYASMSALFMVGWSELVGGGKRGWLQRRIDPWPLPLRWVPRFFSERRGEGSTGHFAEKDGGDEDE